jgi:hypothetical protein
MSADIYSLLVHLHSIGRWVILVLLLFAIFNSLVAGQRPWIRTDGRTGSILTIFADIMFVIGISLWYFGPRGYKYIEEVGMSAVMKNSAYRFFAIEHITMMLIAVILIHIGKTQGRKAISDKAKHRRTIIFYLLALIIILISIPWPFRQIGVNSHWY